MTETKQKIEWREIGKGGLFADVHGCVAYVLLNDSGYSFGANDVGYHVGTQKRCHTLRRAKRRAVLDAKLLARDLRLGKYDAALKDIHKQVRN